MLDKDNKETLQTNSSHEHKAKILNQYEQTKASNQVWFILRIQSWVNNLTSRKNTTLTEQRRDYMVISTAVEKAFDKFNINS